MTYIILRELHKNRLSLRSVYNYKTMSETILLIQNLIIVIFKRDIFKRDIFQSHIKSGLSNSRNKVVQSGSFDS